MEKWLIHNLDTRIVAKAKEAPENDIVGLSDLGSKKEEATEEEEFLKIATGDEEKKMGVSKHFFEGVITKVPYLPETPGEKKREMKSLIRKVVDPNLTSAGYRARDALKAFGKEAVPALLNELVDLVTAAAGKSIHRRHDLSKPQGVRGRNSDNVKLREVLGWEPATSLEEGLRRTYRWIAEQLAP